MGANVYDEFGSLGDRFEGRYRKIGYIDDSGVVYLGNKRVGRADDSGKIYKGVGNSETYVGYVRYTDVYQERGRFESSSSMIGRIEYDSGWVHKRINWERETLVGHVDNTSKMIYQAGAALLLLF
jgi:hypothetical protein